MDDLDYDVLVVGSGFGGSVAALRLTEKGYRVGVLEAGRRFDDSADPVPGQRHGSLPKTSWRIFRYMWAPQFGYLLTCLGTGAWRGSVQVPGSSLSIRLSALVAWLSFGLRGPGAVGRERLKRGVLGSK